MSSFYKTVNLEILKRFQKFNTNFIATQETQQELQNEEHKRELVIKQNVVIGYFWNYYIEKAKMYQ